jgi:hypothetical protein
MFGVETHPYGLVGTRVVQGYCVVEIDMPTTTPLLNCWVSGDGDGTCHADSAFGGWCGYYDGSYILDPTYIYGPTHSYPAPPLYYASATGPSFAEGYFYGCKVYTFGCLDYGTLQSDASCGIGSPFRVSNLQYAIRMGIRECTGGNSENYCIPPSQATDHDRNSDYHNYSVVLEYVDPWPYFVNNHIGAALGSSVGPTIHPTWIAYTAAAGFRTTGMTNGLNMVRKVSWTLPLPVELTANESHTFYRDENRENCPFPTEITVTIVDI